MLSNYALIVFRITPAVWKKTLPFAHKCSVLNIIAEECQSLSLFAIVCLDIISAAITAEMQRMQDISVLAACIYSSEFAFVHRVFEGPLTVEGQKANMMLKMGLMVL